MLRWLQNQWKLAIDFDGYSGQHILRNTIPHMLVLDVHKAQKTPAVKDLMHRFNTLPVMVPAGCTSLVQPLDVCINKPLEDRIRALADQHYVDHILEWSAQKYTASERRILMTQWVGQAWKSIHHELQQTTIQWSFRKCGDHDINI